MKRREFITLLGGAAVSWPWATRAQQQSKMLRVGFVGMQPRESPLYSNFLKRMAELGYQEGRNFTFDYIQTPNVDGYEKSYQELAARKTDVFLAVGNEPALRAALSAADGKPIAFLAVDFDPLTKGYVANLSHPGGNVTGIFVRQIELAAKRVEITREAFPGATVVGIAFDTLSREQGDAAADAPGIFMAMTLASMPVIACARAACHVASPSTMAIPPTKAIMPGKLVVNLRIAVNCGDRELLMVIFVSDAAKYIIIATSLKRRTVATMKHAGGGPRSSPF
jgi:hypothetical protein